MLILLMSLASASCWKTGGNIRSKASAPYPFYDGDDRRLILVVGKQVSDDLAEGCFLTWSVTGIAGVLLTGLIVGAVRDQKRYLMGMGAGILAFCVFTTGMTAWLYQRNSGQSPQEYYDRLKAFGQFSLPDERYRIASSDNTLLMANALSGTGSFTSMVSGSVFRFMKRWESTPHFFSGGAGRDKGASGRKVLCDGTAGGRRGILQKPPRKERFYLCEYETLSIGSVYQSYMTETISEGSKELRLRCWLPDRAGKRKKKLRRPEEIDVHPRKSCLRSRRMPM